MKQFRVRHTWGRGHWSFDYYETLWEATAKRFAGSRRLDVTPLGQGFMRSAMRSTVQARMGSTWKTIDLTKHSEVSA